MLDHKCSNVHPKAAGNLSVQKVPQESGWPSKEREGPCLGKQRVLPLLDIVIAGFAVVRRRILAGCPVEWVD